MELDLDYKLDEKESRESDEDSAREERDIENRSSPSLPSGDLARLGKLGTRVKTLTDAVDNDVGNRGQEDLIEGSRTTTPGNNALYASDGELKKYASDAALEQGEIPEQDRKGRLVTRNKFWAWVLPGLAGAGLLGVAIFNLVRNFTSTSPTPSKPDPLLDALTVGEKELIVSAVNAWKNQPDAAFWERMAVYVNDWAPSLQAQLMFMTYTKQLLAPVDWPAGSASKVTALVTALVGATLEAKNMAALYRKVATLQYAPNGTNVALPRYLAADACELALGQIAKRMRDKT